MISLARYTPKRSKHFRRGRTRAGIGAGTFTTSPSWGPPQINTSVNQYPLFGTGTAQSRISSVQATSPGPNFITWAYLHPNTYLSMLQCSISFLTLTGYVIVNYPIIDNFLTPFNISSTPLPNNILPYGLTNAGISNSELPNTNLQASQGIAPALGFIFPKATDFTGNSLFFTMLTFKMNFDFDIIQLNLAYLDDTPGSDLYFSSALGCISI